MAKRTDVSKTQSTKKKEIERGGSGAILSFEIRCQKLAEILPGDYPEHGGKLKEIFDLLSKLDADKAAEVIVSLIKEPEEHHDIAAVNKRMSDEFARSKGKDLKKVRKEGYKSLRKIAERFNELKIKSYRGGTWSHTTVKNLIHRRRALGLE